MAAVLDRQALDSLQTELRALSQDARKRFPAVKDAAERGILQLRTVAGQDTSRRPLNEVVAACEEIPQAFILGCHTKSPPLTSKALLCLNRLIGYNACSQGTVEATIDAMQGLLDAGIDHIRLCQTINTLLACCALVRADSMAKTAVLCFRLYLTKDPLVANTAAASLRQLSAVIYDRMSAELLADEAAKAAGEQNLPLAKHPKASPMRPAALDGFLFFQDLCQMVNGDTPYWLVGLADPPRMYSLELIESILSDHAPLFKKLPEFSHLVKERVCPTVIKFFSPGAKKEHMQERAEKPTFALSMRLLRIVSILARQFHTLLVTECEIFLSMLVKFLEPDKPFWQRTLAAEVLRGLCAHPALLRGFCQAYDMQEHATGMFGNMVNTLDAFVQGLCQKDAQAHLANMQAATARSILLDALDKSEAPQVSSEYAVSVGFACLLDIVRAMALLVAEAIPEEQRTGQPLGLAGSNLQAHPDAAVWRTMVDVSWCGVLASLSLMLQMSQDEEVTESILRGYRSFINVCAILGMATPRDAFITSLCKAVLPPTFIVRIQPSALSPQQESRGGATAQRPPTTVSANQEDIVMTTKNMQAARALLNVGQSLGNLLADAWLLVMETLQHLDCIVSLHTRTARGRSAMPVPAVAAADLKPSLQLTVLGDLLEQLLSSTSQLEDQAVSHMLSALCTLSDDVISASRIRPVVHVFGMPTLLAVATHNLQRMGLLWPQLVPRRLQASNDTTQDVRVAAVDAFTKLVHSMLEASDRHPVDAPLQEKMFKGLRDLGRRHSDTREGQLDCLLHILQSFGQSLTVGWPYVFDMASGAAAAPAATQTDTEHTADGRLAEDQQGGEGDGRSTGKMVRLGFECIQLVVTDFMALLPPSCLRPCIETVGVFGQQQGDVNISLTAIGLLWNIADYLNRDKGLLGKGLEGGDGQEDWSAELTAAAATGRMSVFRPAMQQWARQVDGTASSLWRALFAQLAALCVDPRPEVRKSSNQTLFGAVGMHGASFGPGLWAIALWLILFPLLDSVHTCARDARRQDEEAGSVKSGLLVHHSRNTAAKQWDESVVISLAGVTGVLRTHYTRLNTLADFPFAWQLALSFIEVFGVGSSKEVASAAVSCMADLLRAPEAAGLDVGQAGGEGEGSWRQAWLVWARLATNNTPELEGEAAGEELTVSIDDPTALAVRPDTLTALVALYSVLHLHIGAGLSDSDHRLLFFVLRRVAACVSHSSNEKRDGYGSAMAGWESRNLMPLHGEILSLYKMLQPPQHIWPDLLLQHLFCVGLAFKPPRHSQNLWPNTGAQSKCNPYRPLYHRALAQLTELYPPVAASPFVLERAVFLAVLEALQAPLQRKYEDPAEVWTDAATALLACMDVALPPLTEHSHEDCGPESSVYRTWQLLFGIIHNFLLCKRGTVEVSYEEQVRDEDLDVSLVKAVRRHVLPSAACLPRPLAQRIMQTLESGSAHVQEEGAANGHADLDPITGPVAVREHVARACFEALLDFSLMKAQAAGPGGISSNATDVLLRRCVSVMQQYVQDEALAGSCPLPRVRMVEVCFVLQGIHTMLQALASARQRAKEGGQCVSSEHEQQQAALVDGLYPVLVDCIGTSDGGVRQALKQVLRAFGPLMAP
eukprot:comp24340_c0_seq1/m.46265 comp24340_c0_seq1/g.46265  ORF comp24340_c0_seq1/g.46265 comp24340_c0_seq1/m.46265 type:complete len:1624 (-) comp24340_c0_seq1:273-5144(-)